MVRERGFLKTLSPWPLLELLELETETPDNDRLEKSLRALEGRDGGISPGSITLGVSDVNRLWANIVSTFRFVSKSTANGVSSYSLIIVKACFVVDVMDDSEKN